mmetsp:Transcript_38955/g.110475  ORF Transcript_38955/g.110475 Transcript_38955/m.110475 type:complete len:217 (+) Transcript_38955:129-779(+)
MPHNSAASAMTLAGPSPCSTSFGSSCSTTCGTSRNPFRRRREFSWPKHSTRPLSCKRNSHVITEVPLVLGGPADDSAFASPPTVSGPSPSSDIATSTAGRRRDPSGSTCLAASCAESCKALARSSSRAASTMLRPRPPPCASADVASPRACTEAASSAAAWPPGVAGAARSTNAAGEDKRGPKDDGARPASSGARGKSCRRSWPGANNLRPPSRSS